jgi:uncharacterized membrane-anchored protein YhcB (DUF1043 family)
MSDNWITALFAGLGALVTAVVGALVIFMNTRHKVRTEAESNAVAHYQAITDRQQREIERLVKHTGELQDAYDQQQQECALCREDLAGLYSWAEHTHRLAERMARRLKLDPGEVPDLPPRPKRHDAGEEFRSRTIKQNSELIRQAAPPPPHPPGEGGNP